MDLQYSLEVVQEGKDCKYLLLDEYGRTYAINKLLYEIMGSYQNTKCYLQYHT